MTRRRLGKAIPNGSCILFRRLYIAMGTSMKGKKHETDEAFTSERAASRADRLSFIRLRGWCLSRLMLIRYLGIWGGCRTFNSPDDSLRDSFYACTENTKESPPTPHIDIMECNILYGGPLTRLLTSE